MNVFGRHFLLTNDKGGVGSIRYCRVIYKNDKIENGFFLNPQQGSSVPTLLFLTPSSLSQLFYPHIRKSFLSSLSFPRCPLLPILPFLASPSFPSSPSYPFLAVCPSLPRSSQTFLAQTFLDFPFLAYGPLRGDLRALCSARYCGLVQPAGSACHLRVYGVCLEREL